MKRITFHKKAHLFLAMLIAFWLPVARLVPLFIVLLLLNWLAEGDFKNKFQLLSKNKFALIFVAFYVLHLIGLFYTSNVDAGMFDIQVKLSLLIFPIVLASRSFDYSEIKKIVYSFILGAVFSSLIMLVRAFVTYFISGENNFFYQAFSSFLLHPSYMSMYLNVAIAWILLEGFKKDKPVFKFQKLIAIALLMYFTIIIVLLSSKLGLASLFVIFVIFIIRYIILHKKYLIGIIGFSFIAITAFCIIRFVPEIRDRVNTALNVMSSQAVDNKNAESTAVRLLVWKAANTVISNNLIVGTGTGDAKDELMKQYKEQGITGAYEHELNAHNEYYQVFVALGIVGFAVFMLSLLAPLLVAIRNKQVVYALFLVVIILNFLTESMLETQAGVMFYAFFNSLFCFSIISDNKTEKT